MNIFLWLGAASVNLRPGCAVLICLSYNWYGKPVTITPSAVFIHWDQYFVSDPKALCSDPGSSLKNISALMLYFYINKNWRNEIAFIRVRELFQNICPYFCLGCWFLWHTAYISASFLNAAQFEQYYIFYNISVQMVVIMIVTQENGKTVNFNKLIPKVHFMKRLSCGLANLWYNLESKKRINLCQFLKSPRALHFRDLDQTNGRNVQTILPRNWETYKLVGQLVITNHGEQPIRLDRDFANFLGISRLLNIRAIEVKGLHLQQHTPFIVIWSTKIRIPVFCFHTFLSAKHFSSSQ